MYDDTIAAIATPLGEGALGVVRMSGPMAYEIGKRVFRGTLKDRSAAYGHIYDPATKEMVDEAMAVCLAAPHTYTREDMIEFTCHGGPLPLQRVLGLLLREGARVAEPGEFTMRAFLNGRIDLAQAEAVLDVIQAKTEQGLQIALQDLDGRLSQEVRSVRAALLEPLAYLTALVDFPEDEVGRQDVVGPLEDVATALDKLLSTASQGQVFRQGIRVAIVGRPNAGKSSLLNLLLGHNRAIVAATPGTTRDTLEEVANIGGVPFVLVDTAGIRSTNDEVEHLGVERSRQNIATADLVLLVIDTSVPLSGDDFELAEELSRKRVLVVSNKKDLPDRAFEAAFGIDADALRLVMALEAPPGQETEWPCVRLSALTGDGLDELQQSMTRLVMGGQVQTSDALLVANPRHAAALTEAARYVESALEGYHAKLPADFLTIDLTSAVRSLGQITGETVEEDLLNVIFSRFCIGK